MYEERFKNLVRVARKITSSLNIGDILVGSGTADRIRSKLQVYDRGFMKFKNVKEKVRIFSLIRSQESNPSERNK